MRALAKIGVNILAVDYRGYGKSEGKPDEAGVYRDADAAYDYLVKQRHFRAEDIIIYGHSLGGAVAVNLASRRPCGGLIVQSSFTSARAMARRMFAIPLIGYVVKSRFDSLQKIRDVHAPILIVHGTRDEVVPFAMGQQLFAAAPEPKRFYPIEGAGHNDLMEAGGEELPGLSPAVLRRIRAGRARSQSRLRVAPRRMAITSLSESAIPTRLFPARPHPSEFPIARIPAAW